MAGNLHDAAIELWQRGYERHRAGDLEGAISLYRQSIDVCTTAEAHTFLGWAYAHAGQVGRAVEECKRAIEVDPDFGNPYNDIGAYLIELGQLEEAIPWLERAKRAPRYEPRHFPYLNLGRLYLAKGDLSQALREFTGALSTHPHDLLAEHAVRLIRARMS
jgi:Tfp pilus assembly protein PilF